MEQQRRKVTIRNPDDEPTDDAYRGIARALLDYLAAVASAPRGSDGTDDAKQDDDAPGGS